MNSNTVDTTKVNRMIKRIIELEKENLRTKRYRDHDMIKRIQKIIEEEVKKCL
jgi:uncharacterized membrane protein (DUF106 family)